MLCLLTYCCQGALQNHQAPAVKPLQVVEIYSCAWMERETVYPILIDGGYFGGEMHEVLVSYTNLSAAVYNFARGAVGVLLWFWMISGATFGLRFLAYLLLDKESSQRPLVAAATLIPFPIERFDRSGNQGPSHR